jgi:hypothetical protein
VGTVSTVNGGDVTYAADVNQVNIRVGTTKLTADSSTWSGTEFEATTVSGTLVSGKRYVIAFRGRISSDVAADSDNLRIREDNLTGTQLMLGQVYLPTNSGNGYMVNVYAEYTAVASGSKTFSFTGNRSIGTGTTHRIRGSATAPSWMTIELINEP